jgi:hypothetical protein
MFSQAHPIRIFVQGRNDRDKAVHEWASADDPPQNLVFPVHIHIIDKSNTVDVSQLPKMAMGEVGSVIIWFDGAERNRLYVNDLGAKSDWYGDDNRFHENRTALDLHRRLKATLKKQLRHGVLISDAAGRGSKLCKGIWLSPGTIAFHAAGGELMQRGVENVRFAPLPESATPANKRARAAGKKLPR